MRWGIAFELITDNGTQAFQAGNHMLACNGGVQSRCRASNNPQLQGCVYCPVDIYQQLFGVVIIIILMISGSFL